MRYVLKKPPLFSRALHVSKVVVRSEVAEENHGHRKVLEKQDRAVFEHHTLEEVIIVLF